MPSVWRIITAVGGMTDTAIKKALARRETLTHTLDTYEQRVKTARSELEEVNRFISAWMDFASDDEKREVGAEMQAVIAASQKQPANPPKEKVASEVAGIIRNQRRPLSRTELYHALEHQGVHIHGKNPEMVLSTMLWRSQDKIVRLVPHGYWVADEAYPPAGYDPHKPYNPKDAPAEGTLLD